MNQAMQRTLVLLHGVNLDLLGERPIQHYGKVTLAQLEARVEETAKARGWQTVCYQTNHEGEFVELVHRFRHAGALLVNPGAWTHYSYAIRDALELVTARVGEVHLSDVEHREPWRRVSVVSDLAVVRVVGKGADGYVEAANALIDIAEAEEASGEGPDGTV